MRRPRSSELAAQIKAAQAPEIAQMQGWLKDWDADAMDGHDMGHDDDGRRHARATPSCASSTRATGAEFDRLWLTGMIAHHEGAVTMAETELADGKDPATSEAAREPSSAAQEKEIATMKGLLG